MNNKNQTTDLSYYGLYLLKYLKENHPDKASDTDFIESRADHAADVYEQSRLEGYTPEGAQELAMAALTKGLHFSKYNTIIEVLWNEFGDEVEPGNAPAFALTLQPEMEEVFARYPLTDNFSDTAIPAALGKESEHSFHSLARNFAYTSEYDLLYTELTGAVATYLEEHGV